MPILKIEFKRGKSSPAELGKGSTTKFVVTDDEAEKIYLDFIGQRILKKSDNVENLKIKYGGLTITLESFDMSKGPCFSPVNCSKESRVRGGKNSSKNRRKKT